MDREIEWAILNGKRQPVSHTAVCIFVRTTLIFYVILTVVCVKENIYIYVLMSVCFFIRKISIEFPPCWRADYTPWALVVKHYVSNEISISFCHFENCVRLASTAELIEIDMRFQGCNFMLEIHLWLVAMVCIFVFILAPTLSFNSEIDIDKDGLENGSNKKKIGSCFQLNHFVIYYL